MTEKDKILVSKARQLPLQDTEGNPVYGEKREAILNWLWEELRIMLNKTNMTTEELLHNYNRRKAVFDISYEAVCKDEFIIELRVGIAPYIGKVYATHKMDMKITT